MDVIVVALVAVTSALLAAAAMSRWPRSPVPRLDPSVIREVVRRHPRLRRMLRARVDPALATGFALTVAVAIIVVAVNGIGLLLRNVRSDTRFPRDDLAIAR